MSQSKFALPRNGFTFKRFFVAHDRCAMKVGTDGILLGAWAPIAGVKHVLDIGAGSGLLALMLAQRTGDDVHVEAVELDEEAAAQARENALASPWASRIEVWQADIHQWQPSQTRRYELIISNPPFFAEGVPCATSQREQARYTTTLDHASLLTCAAEHITEEGFFCVVLPVDIGNAFIERARAMGWHLRLRTDVAETELRPPHRVLLAFSPTALLRSALGMAIVMMLMGMAQNIWQFLLLRALLGLLGGFIPNANALIATQIPRHKSGWALGTLSTGAVSGALLGPLAGGFLADHWGLRTVFFMTAAVLFICFLFTLFLIRENFVPIARKEMLSAREVFSSLQNPKLVLSLFVTSLIIQVATGSIAPILTLYVRDLAGNVSNIAFISGMIASVPGIAALMSAPRLGKLGDRIGPEKILIVALIISVLLLIPMSFVQTPLQLGILRFLLGAADGALLPAVQTLLVYNSTSQISGRIFSYNQSFRDIGNVTGPLIGASVSANYGFRAVFLVTAGVVLFNAIYSTLSLRRPAADTSHSVN